MQRVPYTDRSYMFNYIRQCGTNNPLTDLFINGSNSCGLQRCCVTCNDCGTKLYDILEQEGIETHTVNVPSFIHHLRSQTTSVTIAIVIAR